MQLGDRLTLSLMIITNHPKPNLTVCAFPICQLIQTPFRPVMSSGPSSSSRAERGGAVPAAFVPTNNFNKGSIVTDGPNVCMSYYGYRQSLEAKYRGLQIVFEFFNKLHWPRTGLIAVFPSSWECPGLDALSAIGQILYVPNHHIQDDDLFAFAIAQDRQALLLTNDKFRNHLTTWRSKFGPAKALRMQEWCASHLLTYIFLRDTFTPHPETLAMALKELGRGAAVFRCSVCGTAIASADDIITSRDAAGVFSIETQVNPAGSSFTLMKTRSVFPGATQEHWYSQAGGSITRKESTPSLQDSWFPDYAWSLLFCANECCESTVDSFDSSGLQIKISTTLGWKFRLVRDPSRPQPLFDFLLPEFYGLIHERVINDRFSSDGAQLETLVATAPLPPVTQEAWSTRGGRRRRNRTSRGRNSRGWDQRRLKVGIYP